MLLRTKRRRQSESEHSKPIYPQRPKVDVNAYEVQPKGRKLLFAFERRRESEARGGRDITKDFTFPLSIYVLIFGQLGNICALYKLFLNAATVHTVIFL